LQPTRSRCALTIGNFDGVHRGHRALIDRVRAKARELGVNACVLTFEPHPREFFAAGQAPRDLTRLRDKLELMGAAASSACTSARFDAASRRCPPSDFIDDVLVRAWARRWLLVAATFASARGAGDFSILQK